MTKVAFFIIISDKVQITGGFKRGMVFLVSRSSISSILLDKAPFYQKKKDILNEIVTFRATRTLFLERNIAVAQWVII